MSDMFVIDVERKEITKEFPIVKEWLKKMKKIKLNEGEVEKDKVEFYYSYGFFVPKNKNDEYLKSMESTLTMLYPERLEFELSKVRVNLSIKLDNFIITDRLPKGSIPTKIKGIVAEVTKVKMMVESEFSNNREVLESIPALDKNVVDIEIVKDGESTFLTTTKKGTEENVPTTVEFTIDTILDKISKKGYESLTKEEKEFLDNKSKNM
jgi:hypothetical protein